MMLRHRCCSIKRTLMCGASLCCSSRCLGLSTFISIQTCQRRNASETMSSSSMPLPTVTAEASSLATSVNKVVAPVAVGLDNVAHPFITSNVAPVNLRAQQDAVLPPTTTTAGAMELQSRQRHAAWRRRSLLASKQRFLQHIALHSRVVFSVPSIMDAESFVKFVRHSTQHRLLPLLLKRAASQASTPSSLMSSTSSEDVAALMSITERDVEDVVWRGKESLKSDRSITCMVPYRLAVNMILKRLPPALRAEAIEQLKAAESAKLEEKRQRNAGDLDDEVNILIQWVEADVYGDRDAMRVGSPRTPVYQLLGHTGSGKTTLLRATSSLWEGGGDGRGMIGNYNTPVLPTEHLNGVTIARRSVGIELASAQALLLSSPLSSSSTLQGAEGAVRKEETPLASPRIVLAPPPPPVSPASPTSTTTYPSAVTLIDTPGHRLFAELRLHTLVAVDAVILVINLAAEGGAVQPQTREAIILALNVDRPIVVAFNKLDMFSDEGTGGRALHAAMKQLKDIGLDVSLVSSVQQLHDILDIDDDMMHQQSSEGHQTIRSSSSSSSKWREFVCRQGEIDANFKGSIRDPSMNLRRRALGVCVSASRGWNVDLFGNVLVTTAQLNPPRAIFSDAKAAVSRPCGVQAVVLDATKQAYQTDDDAAPPPAAADGSGQHHYSRRDGYEASISIRKEKSKEKLNRRRGTTSAKTRIMQEQQYYTYGRGGQSGAQMNPYLFIMVVIKSGVLVPGTPFVADQSVGVVEEMLDSYGRVVREAHPGMVVTVVDKHSHCGTPGGGVHLFSLPTSDHAYRVFEHRLLLHRFVSLFPDKTHLLRPRGIDVKHRHLGIYYVPSSSSSSSSSAPNVDKKEIAGEAEAVTRNLGMQLLYGAPQQQQEMHAPMHEDHARLEGGISSSSESLSASPSTSNKSLNSIDVVDDNSSGERNIMSSSMFFDSATRDAPQLLHKADGTGGNNATSSSSSSVGKYLQEQATQAATLEEAAFLETASEEEKDQASKTSAAWLALQPTDQELRVRFASTRAQEQLTHVGVLLKTDSWHAARILQREVLRLGSTRRIQMQVVITRFGRLTLEDFMASSHAIKVILCYRTPPANDVQLDRMLEMQNVRYQVCATLASALQFVKECAVSIDREIVATNATGGGGHVRGANDDDDDERRRKQRQNVVVLDDDNVTYDHHDAESRDDGGETSLLNDGANKKKPLPNGSDAYLGALLQDSTGMSASIDGRKRNRKQKLTRSSSSSSRRR